MGPIILGNSADKAELHESSVVFNLHNVSLKRGVTVNALTRFDIYKFVKRVWLKGCCMETRCHATEDNCQVLKRINLR